ncbi:hypothetical protein SAMN05443428_10568 [Caloramator quimbayensis]|uniref:MrpA C-terminal/MbhE domain-containing protein n=1 Tax=Caloramator quimbayensis TaxID=1147123 RepID=A0A1T4X1C9_9CLOT|nr:hydrogen gas-evolving membrane-bound hydrogenase subunit E [Caloramator quimbayensis]SKA83309.1 hypothetical protein SAMN05443428_10568 [Caloramator quimbayensis]
MKRFFTYFSLSVITVMGIYTMIYAAKLPRTYDGKDTRAYDLIKNPSNYDVKSSDGVSNIIVKENLNKTHAVNAVTAVVFDFRGYDTLGESFILLTAVSGSFVILKNGRRKRDDFDEKKH